MKCENCEYLYKPCYEYDEWECRIFGEEIPEQYQNKNYDGCICTKKMLKEIHEANEKAFYEECRKMAEYFEKEQTNDN